MAHAIRRFAGHMKLLSKVAPHRDRLTASLWMSQGVEFARRWASGVVNGQGRGAEPGGEGANPLRDFFAARREGRGIWKWDHYFEIYHRHLEPLRRRGGPLNVVEIGVYSGGSLEMWR